jgi:hypothetical protein
MLRSVRLLPASRRWRVLLLAAIILLSLAVLLYLGMKPVSPTRPDFARIQPGMTLNEVKGVLDSTAKMTSLNMPGTPQMQYMLKWDDWNAGAMVNFDRSGKVYSKDYIPYKMTPLDRIRHWWYRNIGANPPF